MKFEGWTVIQKLTDEPTEGLERYPKIMCSNRVRRFLEVQYIGDGISFTLL